MARRKNIPYLVCPHGLPCERSLQQSASRATLYFALIERRHLNGSAALEYAAGQELTEAAPLRLRALEFVLSFGLDLPPDLPDARQRLRILIHVPPDELVILFLSRPHQLLAAANTLARRRSSLMVARSGSADYRPQARAQAATGLGPLSEMPFDPGIGTEVIEHLYSPRAYTYPCYQALRPGGRFISYHRYLRNLLLALCGKWDAHADPLWDGEHSKLWTRRTLAILLEETGYQNLLFHDAGRLPSLWMTMVMSGDKPAA